jgi:hypothetical protein
MPNRTSPTGSELFIVDNSGTDWKVLLYLHDWCQISKAVDIATWYKKEMTSCFRRCVPFFDVVDLS